MAERINFTELAEKLGGETTEVALPNGKIMKAPVWTRELGLKALDYFREYAKTHDHAEFDGHADPWIMMGIMNELRDIRVTNYLGPLGDKLDMVPYAVGAEPKEGQPVDFRLEMDGTTAHLTVILGDNANPFAMPIKDIAAPAIPDGSDIIVSLEGKHFIFNFPLPVTYGAKCRTMYMQDGDGFSCCITNTPDVKLGDRK